MHNVHMPDHFEWEPNDRVKRIVEMLESSDGFLEEAERGFQDADAENWVWDEDLDAITTS